MISAGRKTGALRCGSDPDPDVVAPDRRRYLLCCHLRLRSLARHTRGLIEKQPDKFGIATGAFPTDDSRAELETHLQEFVQANEAMDCAVADMESSRADAPVRMMALHGRLAELRINEKTLAYINAPGERLAFEFKPAGNPPQSTPNRKRPRARGRQ